MKLLTARLSVSLLLFVVPFFGGGSCVASDFARKADFYMNKLHFLKTTESCWGENEPDQHVIYAYNYVGAPAKAAEKIRKVLDSEYRNDPWGMSGNEDAGQMSAWYIFSAMGFYPYVHGVPEYVIGSPIFDETTINLASGAQFTVKSKNNSAENIYVQSMKIDGSVWDKTCLPHSAIMAGATIEFVMGPNPSDWGTSEESRPYSMTPQPQYRTSER